MFLFFVFYILSYTLGLVVMVYFDAHRHILSYSGGALVMFVNVLIIVWAWNRIFIKKAITLAVSVIVFKYAILIFVLYWMIQRSEPVFLALGIGVLLPAVLATAVKNVFIR